MKTNLTKFIAIEKVVQTVTHGNIDLGLTVRNGEITGVTTQGKKKTLYNQSEKDINTNEVAITYIAKRIMQQLESGHSGELTFTVSNQKNKIKTVSVESTQTI